MSNMTEEFGGDEISSSISPEVFKLLNGTDDEVINISSDLSNNTEQANILSLLNNFFPNSTTTMTPIDAEGLEYVNDLSGNESRIIDLNKEYTHDGSLMTVSYLVMITFIFYVPRIIYFRVSRISKDRQVPGYFLIWYLSLIACVAAVIHFGCFQMSISGSSHFNSSITSFEEQLSNFYISKASAASINRLVAPIVAVLCIQQIATHTRFDIPILQEVKVHALLCLVITIFVVGYSFLREYFVMSALDSSSEVYPDRIHVDLYDVIAPLITSVLFFFARQNLSRQSVYSIEQCGPNNPTTLDRISKVAVFQTVMIFFTFGSLLMAPSEEQERHADSSGWFLSIFFLTAQTPFVHWVLFRSLLRSRKPTRLCFLSCFGQEEKVGVAPEDVEMERQQNKEANKKKDEEEEEEDDDEDDEPETLDANKIVIMPASQVEEIIRREAIEIIEVNSEDVPEERHEVAGAANENIQNA
ncbi:hypothetical protein GCK72_014699 [Caenorhabditis remanei]|uniref:Uncharacterized protein n=1 Tax=Caenorhabditis remanei TaxID=31234 RepID=A0A6A5GUH3_CAERE|nr:hypothetical protein GCK72_014699 [Caenorhabditis remanei]KAF1758241.1 hypothetical protein GCK72_014699 [Caenorhabditis remanei]